MTGASTPSYDPTLNDKNDNMIDPSHFEKQVETKDAVDFDAANQPQFDEAKTKTLLRKLDINIVPFLALLYLYAFLSFLIETCSETDEFDV